MKGTQSLLKTKDYTRITRKLIISLFIFVNCLIMNIGCIKMDTTIERGVPINDAIVNDIHIGKTTRSELFQLLGTPHSIFHNQAEFKEGNSIISIGEYYSHVENRYLSSIDEGHYAFLYRFGKTSSKNTQVFGLVSRSGNLHINIRSDELLIFINKETNIVDDVAYRRETSLP